jgi:hypothetical protein
MNLATLCSFDLFTLTNFSFMDLALYLGLAPQLYSFVRESLSDPAEPITFPDGVLSKAETAEEATGTKLEAITLDIKYDAEFEVRQTREGIFGTAARVREVVGQVSNIVVFERETFEVIIPEMAVERAVLLKLKDYVDERSVSLVKVKT